MLLYRLHKVETYWSQLIRHTESSTRVPYVCDVCDRSLKSSEFLPLQRAVVLQIYHRIPVKYYNYKGAFIRWEGVLYFRGRERSRPLQNRDNDRKKRKEVSYASKSQSRYS